MNPTYLNGLVEDYCELMECVGKGSFGAVYRAIYKKPFPDISPNASINLEGIVAVKKMKVQKFSEEWEDVAREVSCMRDLSHPNIVTLFSALQQQDTITLVLEFCVGSICDLMDVINRPLFEPEIAGIVQTSGKRVGAMQKKKEMQRAW